MRVIGVAAVLCAMLWQAGCMRFCKSSIYLIPGGYVGRLRVEYGVAGEPALPEEDGRYLIRIPADGRLQTSTEYDEGWHDPELMFYVSGSVRKRLPLPGDPYPVGSIPPKSIVHDGGVGSGTGIPTPTEFWFIGTDKRYADYQKRNGY